MTDYVPPAHAVYAAYLPAWTLSAMNRSVRFFRRDEPFTRYFVGVLIRMEL
ncbi:MAG: hypothetical protein IJ088_10010 [Clostridia bacterium]|nr:hypothetical protein [Clostridia bacterium]